MCFAFYSKFTDFMLTLQLFDTTMGLKKVHLRKSESSV